MSQRRPLPIRSCRGPVLNLPSVGVVAAIRGLSFFSLTHELSPLTFLYRRFQVGFQVFLGLLFFLSWGVKWSVLVGLGELLLVDDAANVCLHGCRSVVRYGPRPQRTWKVAHRSLASREDL